jgi:hypothetical protein
MKSYEDPTGPQNDAQGKDTGELGAHPREWRDHLGTDTGEELEKHTRDDEHPPDDADDHEDCFRGCWRASGTMVRAPTQSHQR